MEACRRLKYTGVELVGGTELATLVEKAMAGPVEKAAVGGEGGRWAAVLWHGGDAAWPSGGAVEREARSLRWRGGARSLKKRGGARSRSHGDLSQRCGEVSFFRMVGGEWMSTQRGGRWAGVGGHCRTPYRKNYRM
jgi:hypothetical protein